MGDTTPTPHGVDAAGTTPQQRADRLRARINELLDGITLYADLPHGPDDNDRYPGDPDYTGCDGSEACWCWETNEWGDLRMHSNIYHLFEHAGFENVAEHTWNAPGHGNGDPTLAIVWKHDGAVAVTVTHTDGYTCSTIEDHVAAVWATDDTLAYEIDARSYGRTETGYLSVRHETGGYLHHPYGPSSARIDDLGGPYHPDHTDWELFELPLDETLHTAITGDTALYANLSRLVDHGVVFWTHPETRVTLYELPLDDDTGPASYRFTDLEAVARDIDTYLERCNRMADILAGSDIKHSVAQAAVDAELTAIELRVLVELAQHSELDNDQLLDAARTISIAA